MCELGRRSSRPRAFVGIAQALVCVAFGCGPEPREIAPSRYPGAGLYTPGSTLGASDPSDVPSAAMGLGNRCVPLAGAGDGGVANGFTTGTLRIDYTTQSLHGRYAPKNCTAVWLETVAGQFVATLEVAAGLRKPALVYFQDHACTEKPGPDVVTSATLPDHTKPHSATWSGVDFGGNPMPDGFYKLFIEVTESDKEPGELSVFDVEKGAAASRSDAPVAFDGPLRQVTITRSLMMPGGKPNGAAGGN